MCLIIHKPQGVEVPLDLLESAWVDNGDGAGLMYMTATGPATYKAPPGAWVDTPGHLAKVLAPLADKEVGIHFRWRTHGPINSDNCHPFLVAGGSAYVMHNGILQLPKEYNAALGAAMSDTGYYCATALKGAPRIADADFWNLVAADIGTQNKLLVMDDTGTFLRINDASWSNYKGLRISNTYSIPETSTYRQQWQRYGDGYPIGGYDYSDRYPSTGRSLISLPSRPVSGNITSITPPAKLTRRERKVLSACLAAGNWGPFARLHGGKPSGKSK
jgi:predicted glutamine amidotransferase